MGFVKFLEKNIINSINKLRPNTIQVDINEYNEETAKLFIKEFDKHYEILSYLSTTT